jgi:hypothetical protein
VPAAFELVIVRAMQKDPAARFQTAAELGAALLPFASPRVRLNYEHELGSAAAASERAAAPAAKRGRMFALVLLLGVVAAVVGGLLLRGTGAQHDDATKGGQDPKVSPADHPQEAQARAARALTPASPLALAVDAGSAGRARLSAAEVDKLPAGASEPSERATPSAGRDRLNERVSGAGSKHRGVRPGRGPDTAGTTTPSVAGPRPDHAATTAPTGDEELFRDRK